MFVKFILRNGAERICECSSGETILHIAERENIPLFGSCEGSCVCGSCHVEIDDAFLSNLPIKSDHEEDALDNANGVTMNTRLACQIVMCEEIDGIVVRLS